jgi:DNA-binding LacI/PurR family transcriptional regulator
MAVNGERPRIAEIAELAGVSTATISRVINGKGKVSDGLRKKVEAVLISRGYPNIRQTRFGEKVSSGKTVAVQISDFLNPLCGGMLEGIYDEAEKKEYEVVVVGISEDVNLQRVLDNLDQHSVDGIIACASNFPAQALIEILEKRNIPIISVNRRIDHPRIPCITVDFENATYQRTRYLINMNHRRIGILTGPNREPGPAHLLGYQKAMQEAGLEINPAWHQSGLLTVEGGFQTMNALLYISILKSPTAVITSNDLMALGAMDAIRMQGLRVPEDISVVGFDDIIMAAHSNPPLTTISMPKFRIGKIAIQLLDQILVNKELETRNSLIVMESPLIVRMSTIARKLES